MHSFTPWSFGLKDKLGAECKRSVNALIYPALNLSAKITTIHYTPRETGKGTDYNSLTAFQPCIGGTRPQTARDRKIEVLFWLSGARRTRHHGGRSEDVQICKMVSAVC